MRGIAIAVLGLLASGCGARPEWGTVVESDVGGACRNRPARLPVVVATTHDRAGAGPLTLVIRTIDLDTGDPSAGVLATLDGDDRNAQMSDGSGAIVFAAVDPGKHEVEVRGASDGAHPIRVDVIADQTTAVEVRVDGVPRCR